MVTKSSEKKKQGDTEMENNKFNITNTINIYLFSSMSSLKDIKL